MIDIWYYIWVFWVWFLSAFVWAVCGWGGGMISVPWLIMLWLSPMHAVANITAAAIGDVLWSSVKFYKEGKIKTKYAWHIVAVAFIWTTIWIHLLTNIDPEVMKKSIWFVLLILVPLLFVDVKKFELSRQVTWARLWLGFLLFVLIAIYTVMFSANAWFLAIFTLIYFFWYDLIKSHAVMRIFFLAINCLAFPLLFMEWLLTFPVLITLFVSMFLWWYVWAATMLSLPQKYLRMIMAAMVIWIVVKLFLFP